MTSWVSTSCAISCPFPGLSFCRSFLWSTLRCRPRRSRSSSAYAKANPGKINFASVGSGAATDVAGELFNMMAGVHLVNVPYRSSYLPDLLSGQVQASFTPILQTLSFIRAGQTAATRSHRRNRAKVLPDIPTIGQFVPGYQAVVSDGIGAPPGRRRISSTSSARRSTRRSSNLPR